MGGAEWTRGWGYLTEGPMRCDLTNKQQSYELTVQCYNATEVAFIRGSSRNTGRLWGCNPVYCEFEEENGNRVTRSGLRTLAVPSGLRQEPSCEAREDGPGAGAEPTPMAGKRPRERA